VATRVLFVCLGNICRSPLAEAAFNAEAKTRGLDAVAESAGTGTWNLGNPPDPRAQKVARAAGYDISGRVARLVTSEDFRRFDRLIALDAQNLADLRAMAPPGTNARLSLLLDHVPGRKGQAVADPYQGPASGFDQTWKDVSAGVRALADELSRAGDGAGGSAQVKG